MLMLLIIQYFFTLRVESRVFCQDSNVTPWTSFGPSCPINCGNVIITKQTKSHNMKKSRVFCQDSNSTPWTSLGPSCPVNCGNVITAIMELRSADYTRILNLAKVKDEKANTHFKLIDQAIQNVTINSRKYGNNTFKIIKNYITVLNNDNVLREMERFAENSRLCMKRNLKIFGCRRSTKDSLKEVTSILNKYKHNDYHFTEKITSIILNDLLGIDLNLRYGVTDVKKILLSLKTAMTFYEAHMAMKDSVITLRHTHCVSVYVTGCFCKQGYVEDSGQCVLPKDCISDVGYTEYLSRIIVN